VAVGTCSLFTSDPQPTKLLLRRKKFWTDSEHMQLQLQTLGKRWKYY